ncbi:hypothetical protein O9929_14725 [Vibrio lentus]|nr:hypothetical protein [Vibrio lentus]
MVDYHDPPRSSNTLMIGPEYTSFIAEITYNTVIEHPNKASALLVFADIEQSQ